MARASEAKKDTIRTFVCIEIPDSIRARIGRLQTTLEDFDCQVSWTKPTNIHLTLKFLGAVEPSRIPRVCNAVERAATGIERFEIEVRGTGCFPSPRSPRVLWIGIPELPEPLKRLCDHLEDELALEGFDRENRKFSPHLTIGRLRTPKNAMQLAEGLLASDFKPETFKATEVIVMRSDLRPAGSIYIPQGVIELA